jgi:flagellar motor protein MotB
MRGTRLFAEAALAAALLCGCVSVAEHEALKKQLAVEQARVREQEERMHELGLAVRKQRNLIRVTTLERDEAREKLALAEAALPVVVGEARPSSAPLELRSALSSAASAKEDGGAEAESVLAGTVSFTSGSLKLADGDLARLGAIVRQITARGYAVILVEGHSDPTPLSAGSAFQSNMHLSTVRALAVYHAIIEMPGVEPARVRVVGHGEFGSGPRRPDSVVDPAGTRPERPGRRVEVRYVPAASSAPRAGPDLPAAPRRPDRATRKQ